jgi:Ca2+-binding EF-hand superfamily protein
VKRRNSAANDPFLKFQKKFAPLLEQHDPIQKKLAPLLEQHGTIRKLASEYELKDEANDSVSANFPTGLLDSSSCITSSEQTSPAPANYFGDTVYIQAERFFEAEAEAETAERTSDDASSLTGSTDLCNFDPEEFMPASSPKAVTITGLQNVQPVDMEKKATIDDNSTAPTSSRSTGIDESLEACSIEALVSPVRVKKQTNNRARNFFRGLTVGVNQQFDTNCIPEEKLDNLEKMFKQYDEDSNGQLNVLEFGKFLQDQGMEIEISDLKEAVAMVAPAASPEGRSGIDLNSFKELIAHGLKAEELREEQYCGYSQEDADVLRGVFDAYDANHTGVLEAAEIGNLLEDMGQAPQSLKEQEALRAVLERIVGGTLRPLRFREFLELAKILEKTTIGSGGKSQDHGLDQRRSSDRMEVARKAGLTMADVRQLQEIFTSEAKHGATLSSIDLHQMLKSRLKLYGTDGEREQQVHVTITKHEGAAGSFEFDDFMAVVIDLVVANLATVPALLGEKSTNNFLGHMASLLL